jgi:hypothetical protein
VTIKGLTYEQHRDVLTKLVKLAKSMEIKQLHNSGPEYTSLMVCFLKHSLTSAECLIRLYDSFGDEFFPTTVGYTIVRPMFEIDVRAHYITLKPTIRAQQYIEYGRVIEKQQMKAWGKHRNSKKPDWHEAMNIAWHKEWAQRESDINSKYNTIRSKFEKNNKPFRNWSGKTIRDMAADVDHEEAYDIFYADLSSFTHADVRLADRFLQLNSNGISWSSQAHPFDIGGVFRYADIFLSCFLSLFGKNFNLWTEFDVKKCWD